jgi:hypothetical protein
MMRFKPRDKPEWTPDHFGDVRDEWTQQELKYYEWQKEVAKMVNDLLFQVKLLALQLELEEDV